MEFENLVFQLIVIIVSAACLGTLFLSLRQPIMIAYITVGILFGPNCFGFIQSTDTVEEMAHIGVILLLFLVGLNLQPKNLPSLFRRTALVVAMTSMVFAAAGFGFAMAVGLPPGAAMIFGAAMMFSSTVVGLKLVPTTTLHHRRAGEVMTGVLLIQDMLAILLILFITGEKNGPAFEAFLTLACLLALLCLLAFSGVKYVMVPLLEKFDVVQEYTFVATLGWCFLWAEAAQLAGLSYEIGAFVAGVSIASCRAAKVIAEQLKSLREFFLILFFFAVGARLDFHIGYLLLLAGLVCGLVLVPIKAWVFRFALNHSGETRKLSRELGVRLAQSSEFSLLLVIAAASSGLLEPAHAMVIQIATITSFVVSTYWTVWRFPTPISMNAAMRKD